MSASQRLERDLPFLLEELYMGGTPDYRDDLVRQIGDTRQRPAWTFPERWLPMDITTERVNAPRVPWRALGLVALLALLIATGVAVYIGSQPRLPAPFGPAATGLVAYAADGDIYTADPTTGRATAVVTGPETDIGPRFSRDGTKLVFARNAADGTRVMVAGTDGSDVTPVTPQPVTLTPTLLGEPWEQYQFSPDGRSVVIATLDGALPRIQIADVDGSGTQTLDLQMSAYEPSFRPPDGAEILFVGRTLSGGPFGVYAVDPTSGSLRTIVEPTDGYDLAGAEWSPEGSRIAYWRWGGPGSDTHITAKSHVVAADGTGDIVLPDPEGAVWNAGSAWSNDGTRLFIVRGYAPAYEDTRAVVIPADGSSTGVELPYDGDLNRECCVAIEWSPDDSSVLVTPADGIRLPLQQVIFDPLTGASSTAPWDTTSDPAWQRRAAP